MSASDVKKQLSAQWKQISPTDRHTFVQMEKVDAKRFEEEMRQYTADLEVW